jgi:hypothetical protein
MMDNGVITRKEPPMTAEQLLEMSEQDRLNFIIATLTTSIGTDDFSSTVAQMLAVHQMAAYGRGYTQAAKDCAEHCADIDGGENMFSRSIRHYFGVK